MRRLLALLLVALGLALVQMSPASADCQYVDHVVFVQGTAQINTVMVCEASSDGGLASVATVQPPRDSDWDASCVRTAISMSRDPFRFCNMSPDAQPPALTPGIVGAAFRNLPLPPSVLVVQPPGRRTLVNFATNFYTESGPFMRSVVLLGRRVELRIWPSRFGWVFGDGASLATSSAGSPFPDLEVTHGYRSAGRVGPRVDTTYAAEFRVDGGRWRAVPGSVTIAGAAVDLEVITARPVLVAAR